MYTSYLFNHVNLIGTAVFLVVTHVNTKFGEQSRSRSLTSPKNLYLKSNKSRLLQVSIASWDVPEAPYVVLSALLVAIYVAGTFAFSELCWLLEVRCSWVAS